MKRLTNSIRGKLAATVILAVVFAMLIATLATAWRDADRRYQYMVNELDAIAATLAASVSEPLATGARRNVVNALRAVRQMPRIVYARISDSRGRTVAEFGQGIVLASDSITATSSQFGIAHLSLHTMPYEAPIVRGGKAICEIALLSDISYLRAALLESLLTALMFGGVAAVLGVLATVRIQAAMTAPILELTRVMQRVRDTKDFRVAVPRTSSDETGLLVDAFNDMLSQIRQRDQALARHRDQLEQDVAERTRDLKQAKLEAERANAAKSDFLATMSTQSVRP